ncbi:MAG: histidine kinase [Chitinophagaceae bacterium]|nr:histidine kinase [Chitinophagaceae bacterium]
MKISLFSRKWVIVLLHAAAWILLFSLPFLLRPSYEEQPQSKSPKESSFMLFYIINNVLWVGLFYLNAFALIPRLVYKKQYSTFLGLQILLPALFVLIGWLTRVLFSIDQAFNWRGHILGTIFIFLFILAASTAYRMGRDRVTADRLAKNQENEHLKTELALLRSQVSPHFMFNVLNNMVALARKKSELLEPSLIKLSSLMRYMLYDADGDKVSLEKEIDYLQSYIDLQKQRFGKNVTVVTEMTDMDGSYEIEPMLLIPFVENAFKHGTGFMEDARIEITLQVKNNKLNFAVKNRFNNNSDEIKDRTSGIGLTNVKRRLNLLYGDKQQLDINREDGWFTTSLQLNLH